MIEKQMRTCPNEAHVPPAEVRHGSAEAYRAWLRTRPACPDCGTGGARG